MSPQRSCTRNGCQQPAAATLTFVYADSSAVLGPLAATPEPHSYDVCHGHGARLTAPLGWELVRIAAPSSGRSPQDDDLLALADVVRPLRPLANLDPDVPRRPAKSDLHPAGRGRPHLYVVE